MQYEVEAYKTADGRIPYEAGQNHEKKWFFLLKNVLIQ